MSAKWALLAVFLILVSTTPVAEEEQGIILEWERQFPSRITAIIADDWDNDSSTEIIVAASRSIYILDSEGELEKEYTIDSDGEIYALAVGSIDNRTGNEILAGTGFTLRERSNDTWFEFTGTEATEKTEYLYETIRNKGELYVISDDEISELKDMGEWIRTIHISNLDNNGTDEIIVGTGGANTDWMMEYGDWIETICSYKDRPGFDTLIYNCSDILHNASWHRVSYEMNNGSVYVLIENGSVLGNYVFDDVVWGLSTSDLFHDQDEEIVVGSGDNVYALDKDLGLLWSYPRDGTVKKIEISDIDRNGNEEIIAEFRATNVNGIAVIEREGEDIWEYRLKGDVVRDFSIRNIDLDEEEEVLVASSNSVYVVDKDGRLKREFWIFEGIDNILSTDMDNNGYQEIILTSEDTVYSYEISERLIIGHNATIHYSLAEKNYGLENYQKAMEFTEIAKGLYSEINDPTGISKCDSLLEKIQEGINRNKEIEARSLYNQAMMKYLMNDYLNAKVLAERARWLYVEINHPEGIETCSSLIDDINREGHLENVTVENITSTTSTITNITTISPTTLLVTIVPIDEDETPNPITDFFMKNQKRAPYAIGVGVVMLITFLIIRNRYFKKKEEMKARIGEGKPIEEKAKPEEKPAEEKPAEEAKPEPEKKEEPKPAEQEKPEAEEEPAEGEELELPETPELAKELDEIDKEFQEKYGKE
ncbi:MAG: PQQ-like beta-propeller repeat protein [Candidatus Altiarchaeales archaeon]|nr:PQQ-like beta-propeller repeat protein [Candidatus Altiarchaeota archaeon]MBU4267104.1 PQQ-like beta-propeller repeat protein [Candidatus Altiarchaeota archaeon]MBU4341905.1 PQQ-like beta-propeller repeat protein [Candidatus Altiarchaeota archaeon]MBU4406195.1 PQQ-like beta-propeller repeat protein [Candidatus Altiarchaeota archaeon]MCG2782951.1 PQQ-like beta-propeller repeat protein [Candidatus Altiarchaeales archaeon]